MNKSEKLLKSFKEGHLNTNFKFTKNSKTIPDNVIFSFMEENIFFFCQGLSDDIVTPWDSHWEISGDTLIVKGNCAPQGMGYAEIRIALKDANDFYEIRIEGGNESPEAHKILLKYGYNYN